MNGVKVYGFNEAMLFGNIPMVGGVSVGPVSERELQQIKDIGFKYDLIPIPCERCADLARANQELSDRIVSLEESLAKATKKAR